MILCFADDDDVKKGLRLAEEIVEVIEKVYKKIITLKTALQSSGLLNYYIPKFYIFSICQSIGALHMD